MFPFTTCVGLLRGHERASDWKQIHGTLTFLLKPGYTNEGCGVDTCKKPCPDAIYIQMLGPVHLADSSGEMTDGQGPHLAEADRKMLERLSLPGQPVRLRSRFMSVSKGRQQRKTDRRSPQVKLSVDEFYHSPVRCPSGCLEVVLQQSGVCVMLETGPVNIIYMLMLLRAGAWDFNIFRLDSLSDGRCLLHLAYHLFQTYDFIRGFQLDTVRLIHFLSMIEQNYHDSNPYHNTLHAADVTQAVHCYLQEKKLYDSTSDLEKMAAIVAALTHDLDHPGVNNTFLIVTSNHLASLYQNMSVLENHHWRSAVGLLQETGLFFHMAPQEREKFVKQLKALILATDITRQQEFLLRFNRYIDSGEFQYQRNEEHRLFLLQIALKCADISNPCRPWKISKCWSRRICREFFLQGDAERTLNLTVTPLCDRYGNTVANIQHGFIQFVVFPLFKAWDKFLGTSLTGQMIFHVSHNQSQWKTVMDSGKEVSELDSDPGEGQFEEEEEERSKSKIVQEKDVREKNVEETFRLVKKDNDAKMSQKIEGRNDLSEEEEEGRSEEDDVVENDVNLVYHYQTESDESGRCLRPVSEDNEPSVKSAASARRYSAPVLIRKDLNFYLGLRKDLSLLPGHVLRRQSLPTTVMYFHSSSGGNSAPSPHSMSMDVLLSRPKISNLSPALDMGFVGSDFCQQSFTPLKNQVLLLQGGSLTRFVSNTSFRRASYDPTSCEHRRASIRCNLTSEPSIPFNKNSKPNCHQSLAGLASSWPTMTEQQKATSGLLKYHPVPLVSSMQSLDRKSDSNILSNDSSNSEQVFTSATSEKTEKDDSRTQSASSDVSAES